MIKSYFQIFVYDKNNSYLRKSRKRRSRSFVQGFLKLHFLALDVATGITVTDIAGTSQSIGANNSNGIQSATWLFCSTSPGRGGSGLTNEGAGLTPIFNSATNSGIVLGTGSVAITPTDYSLGTQIVDGITAGTLEHFPCSGTGFTSAGTTASFTLERLFRNSSSGTITINEIGLYGVCVEFSNGGSNIGDINRVCLIRDLVSPGFAVADGEYLRVVYTLSVTA